MLWSAIAAALAVVLIVIGGMKAFAAIRRTQHGAMSSASPNIGILLASIGAALLLIALTLADKVH